MSQRFANAPIHERYHPLRDRFNELNTPKTLERLVDELLERAREWRFASGDMLEAELFPHVLEMKPKRRWKKTGALPKGFAIEYGLDADCVIVARRDRLFCGEWTGRPLTYYRAVLRDAGARTIEVLQISRCEETEGDRRDLEKLRRYELDDAGRTVRALSINPAGRYSVQAHCTAYTWHNGRLVRSEYMSEDWYNHAFQGHSRPLGEERWEDRDAIDDAVLRHDYAYDEQGLDTIRAEWVEPGYEGELEMLRYRRPRKGETPKELAPKVEEAIVAGVVRALTERPPSEPVFALALAFSDGQATMPPSVFLCPASWRDRVVDEHGRKAKAHLWVAEEWPGVNSEGWSPAEFEDARDACAMFNMVTEAGGAYATMRKVLKNAATRLAAHDWSGVMETTDDFVVFPYDVDGGLSVASQVKACSSEARFASLKDRRLL